MKAFNFIFCGLPNTRRTEDLSRKKAVLPLDRIWEFTSRVKSNQFNKLAGFTIIELLITLVIAAILMLTSIYIYSQQVRKGRRMDAIQNILSISLAEEQYRSNNTTYGTLAQLGNSSTSSEGYYTISISNTSSTSYTVTATAIGNQANDAVNGTSCSTLTLAMSNGTITKTPSVCWPT